MDIPPLFQLKVVRLRKAHSVCTSYCQIPFRTTINFCKKAPNFGHRSFDVEFVLRCGDRKKNESDSNAAIWGIYFPIRRLISYINLIL
jgi:hypothetical protein